jgi:hypothetical protein
MPTALQIISLHLLYVEVLFNNAVYICGHAIRGDVMQDLVMYGKKRFTEINSTYTPAVAGIP